MLQDEPGLGGARTVGHEERDAIGRMPRRRQHADPDVAEVEMLFVGQINVRETNISRIVHEDRRPGGLREPAIRRRPTALGCHDTRLVVPSMTWAFDLRRRLW